MEQKKLIELLHLVGQSNLMEFHLKDGGFELYLNKNIHTKKAKLLRVYLFYNILSIYFI